MWGITTTLSGLIPSAMSRSRMNGVSAMWRSTRWAKVPVAPWTANVEAIAIEPARLSL